MNSMYFGSSAESDSVFLNLFTAAFSQWLKSGPTSAISLTAASALCRTIQPQRAGIISARKTATPLERAIWPTCTSAAKAFDKALHTPSIGFQKSARQGHTGARIKLGFLLMNGLGTAKDSPAAYAWILSASQAGDHRGDDYLIELQRDLDQPHLAHATEQARSLEPNAAQRNVRVSLVP
jgi:hypothetical protein